VLAELATIRDPAIIGVTLPAEAGGEAMLAAERDAAAALQARAATPDDDPRWLATALGASDAEVAAVRGLCAALGLAPPPPLPPATPGGRACVGAVAPLQRAVGPAAVRAARRGAAAADRDDAGVARARGGSAPRWRAATSACRS
jgi:hypothetical protein